MAKRLDSLEEKFLKTVSENNLINKGDIIVVGVSGGPDSITLLTCLNKYKEKLEYKIIVAHINHLIRKDSTEDEQFVENLCRKLKIKCYIKRAEVEKIAKETKKGTEEVGRKIRYDFFDEVANKEKANKIAIAHNMNDNAETILLNLIRGTGTTGLEGIQPKEYGKYIRPLINCKREEIEAYCKINNLEPRIDSSNKENIYRRNIIRNSILPQIKEINPNIVESLSRTSKIIKDQNNYIKNETEKIFDKICLIYNTVKNEKNGDNKEKYTDSVSKIEIEIGKFNEQDKAIKENLIIKIIEKITKSTKNIEKVNIDDIIKLAQNNIGNKYMKVNKKIKVSIKNKKIIFERLL